MTTKIPVIQEFGEFSLIQSGDAISVRRGGTGLTSVTSGNYLSGNDSSTLQERTPVQVRSDISAIAFTISETEPVSKNAGDKWLKLSTGKKYTWVVDGDSSQWVELELTTNGVINVGAPLFGNIDCGSSSSNNFSGIIINCGNSAP